MGSCKHWIQTQNEDKQNTQHKRLQLPIPGCPVGFLCLCCVFCLSSFCVLYPMFTAAHSWLSRRFSMFVVCILFFFVLEWAAVNIGYNKQNEDKQNTHHKHRKPTGQPAMGSC
jgi:hypothetical protein